MIALRRSQERGKTAIDWLESYHSFSFGEYWDPKFEGFRTLRVINEDFIAGGGGFGMHPHRNMEIVTYILSGNLVHQDSLGTRSVLKEGCIQRMTAGKGILHSEENNSASEPIHLLQIWILPQATGLAPGYEESSLDAITGDQTFKLIASPMPPKGVLKINQDAEIYSSKLPAGQVFNFSPRTGKGFWIQIISGDISVNNITAAKGDAIYGADEASLEVEASTDAHLLLFHL